MNDNLKTTPQLLSESLDKLFEGFSSLPDFAEEIDIDAVRGVLLETAERMGDNFPYFHPFYAGQMLKPPHPVAKLAYALSLWINPNNHALDGGRASSAMEKEAVAAIAKMFGWNSFLGHLCGGGTMANLEALWIAGEERPEARVVASAQAHYTHQRLTSVLRLPFANIACDSRCRMDLDALEKELKSGDVGTVVATAGTTAAGAVDPIADIVELKKRHGFRLHVDAAYGGYFTLIDDLEPDTRRHLDAIGEADSIVVDPHKHGLQPYGCGCVLFKDPNVGRHYRHDSPYTYFTSDELHLGEISLECSRPGAAAVALWATIRLLPLVRDGVFADNLRKSRRAAVALYEKAANDDRFLTLFPPELDIAIFAPRGKKASDISQRSTEVFEKAARRGVHLALVKLPAETLRHHWPDVDWDAPVATCLRSCLMKPEHEQWLDRIWGVILESTGEFH